MGPCASMPRYRLVKAQTLFMQDKKYPKTKTCKIKKRNHSKKIIGFQEFFLTLADPLEISSYKTYLDSKHVWISTSVLPAINPKDTAPVPCQDRCKVWNNENILLVALFDGFGAAGDTVAEICIEECEAFFYDKFLLLSV